MAVPAVDNAWLPVLMAGASLLGLYLGILGFVRTWRKERMDELERKLEQCESEREDMRRNWIEAIRSGQQHNDAH